MLDSKRAYNVEISLSKFRHFESYESVANAVETADHRLNLDMYTLLKKIYPSSTEITLLKRYRGEVQTLGKAEQFQLAMLRVPRCLEKIDCLLFCAEFEQTIANLDSKMDLLVQTTDAIVRCDPLVHVLKKVLKVGNTMNAGTQSGGAKGFTLESLSKLSTTKGADKKTTVLDVVVAMIFKKIADNRTDDQEVQNPFAWVDKELGSLAKAKEESQRDLQNAVLKIFQQTKKYNGLLAQGLFHASVVGDGPSAEKAPNVLQKFSQSSQDDSLSLRKKGDLLAQKATELAGYWGEDPREMPIQKVAGILSQFSVNLKQSVIRLLRMNQNAKKAAKRWRDKAAKGSSASSGGKNSLEAFEEDQSLIAGNRGALLNSLVSTNPMAKLKSSKQRKRAVTTSVLPAKTALGRGGKMQ